MLCFVFGAGTLFAFYLFMPPPPQPFQYFKLRLMCLRLSHVCLQQPDTNVAKPNTNMCAFAILGWSLMELPEVLFRNVSISCRMEEKLNPFLNVNGLCLFRVIFFPFKIDAPHLIEHA